ncbi:MAG: hypothetical protein WC890_07815 [Candidatus Margulisiibacteriota bacterium]
MVTAISPVCSDFRSNRIYEPATSSTKPEGLQECCSSLTSISADDLSMLHIYLLINDMLVTFSHAFDSLDEPTTKSKASEEGLRAAKLYLTSLSTDDPIREALLPIINDSLTYFSRGFQNITVVPVKSSASDDGLFSAKKGLLRIESGNLTTSFAITSSTLQKIRALMGSGTDIVSAVKKLVAAVDEATNNAGTVCAESTVTASPVTIAPTITGTPVIKPSGNLRPGQSFTVTITGAGLTRVAAQIQGNGGLVVSLITRSSSDTEAVFSGIAPEKTGTYEIPIYEKSTMNIIKGSSINVALSFMARVPWRVELGFGTANDRTPKDSVLALREGIISSGLLGADLLNLGVTDITNPDKKIIKSDTLTLSVAWKGYSPDKFFDFNPFQVTGNLDYARRYNPVLGLDFGIGAGYQTAQRTITTSSSTQGDYSVTPTLSNSSNSGLGETNQYEPGRAPSSRMDSHTTDNVTWEGMPLRLHASLINIYMLNSLGGKTNIGILPFSSTLNLQLFTDQESRQSLSTFDLNPQLSVYMGSRRAMHLDVVGDLSSNFLRKDDDSHIFDSIGIHVALGWRNPVTPKPYKDK